MAPAISKKTLTLVLCSAAVAIGAMLYFRSMPDVYFPNPNSYDFAWEKAIVVVIAVFSLVLGFLEPRAPWRWPLLIMIFHYLSGFVLLEHWGQVPPLELLYAGFLSIPGVAAAYLGAFLAGRRGNAT